jgi:hypothetical protein
MKEISIQAGLTVVADSQPQLEVPTRSASAAYPLDGETLTLRSQRARAEIQAVRNALEQTGWNRKRADCWPSAIAVCYTRFSATISPGFLQPTGTVRN